MFKLVDTERQAQQPLDMAASSVLTDRRLHSERASWQQCSGCNEWVKDDNIEYMFECVLGIAPSGKPTVNFELKTRYPAYTCSPCCNGVVHSASVGAGGGGVSDDGEDSEQLCPLHVQAVYMLHGSNNADNMKAITKGFTVHCPDCGLMSNLLQTQQQVRQYIQQHSSRSHSCVCLQQAWAAGTYNSPAAFGGGDGSRPVAPEKVIKELLSRLVVLTACHIVHRTRPPPTPVDQLSGAARAAAAATKDLRSSSMDGLGLEGLQLMPYRAWAVDALSRDSDLLTEANWVRPSLEGLSLDHKPSLLDLVLAPPYIAVAEHDAGMTVDKLAVLLLRQQKRQQYGSLLGLTTAATAGERRPAAIAAAEATLANILATDSVFAHYPADERVQQFLAMAGIPTIGDIVYALAQPHVRSARNLNVCAVCGMSAGALKRARRPWGLHRCKYCIICTCQACRQEQQQQHAVHTASDAAAADQLCLWCQGHPDTQAGQLLLSSRGRRARHHGASAQPLQLLGRRQAAATAGVDAQQYDEEDEVLSDYEGIHRPPQHYDLVVEMAMAAAAAGSLGDNDLQQPMHVGSYDADHQASNLHRQQQSISSKLTVLQSHAPATEQVPTESAAAPVAEFELPAATNKLDQEIVNLQQLQDELDQLLSGQDLQLSTHPQQHQEGEGQQFVCSTGRQRPPFDGVDEDYAPCKRQRTTPHQQHQQDDSSGAAAVAAAEAQAAGATPLLLKSGQCKATPEGDALAADDKCSKAAPLPGCGKCSTCNDVQSEKVCVVNREQLQEGTLPTLPTGTVTADTAGAADAAGTAAADFLAEQNEFGSSGVSEFEDLPMTRETGQAAGVPAGVMLTSAGLHRDEDSLFEEESPYVTESEPVHHSQAAVDEAEAALVAGQALPPAPLVSQQQQQQQQLPEADAGSQQPADAVVAVSAASALKQQPYQPPAASMGTGAAAVGQAALTLSVVDHRIAWLSPMIHRYCSSKGVTGEEAIKTLLDMQQLRQQLADGHQQTAQPIYTTGLQALAEIADSIHSVNPPASKVALASNMQLMVPAAYCPNSTACSVFELLMCCWFKEVQDTGLTVDQGKVAARQGAFAVGDRHHAIAGLCQLTLRLLGQFSKLSDSAQQAAEDGALTAGVAAIQQAVVHLLSGTALVLLHWPEKFSGSAYDAVPIQWRRCLIRWEPQGALNRVNIVQARDDLQQHCRVLSSLALKPM